MSTAQFPKIKTGPAEKATALIAHGRQCGHQLGACEWVILEILCTRAGNGSIVDKYPGHDLVARVIGESSRGVRRGIGRLRDAGLIHQRVQRLRPGSMVEIVFPPDLEWPKAAQDLFGDLVRGNGRPKIKTNTQRRVENQQRHREAQDRKEAERLKAKGEMVTRDRDAMKDQDIQLATENLENMERYLRVGLEAINACESEYERLLLEKPSSLNWCPDRIELPEFPDPTHWNPAQFAGYYWFIVSWFRCFGHSEPRALSLPPWSRLIGDMRNLRKQHTTHALLNRIQMMACHFHLVNAITFGAKAAFEIFNEHTLTNSLFQSKLDGVLSQSDGRPGFEGGRAVLEELLLPAVEGRGVDPVLVADLRNRHLLDQMVTRT